MAESQPKSQSNPEFVAGLEKGCLLTVPVHPDRAQAVLEKMGTRCAKLIKTHLKAVFIYIDLESLNTSCLYFIFVINLAPFVEFSTWIMRGFCC